MPTSRETQRAPAWGADLPLDEAQARERILDAAEKCYVEMGPARSKMTHIATRAGIHRTTVYSYFPNREAVLAACYLRATNAVLEAAERCWQTDKPFIDQLIDACVMSLRLSRESPVMSALISPDEFARTVLATKSSEGWQALLDNVLARRLADAVHDGEVRSDVPTRTLVDWVTRICMSLAAVPSLERDGGDEGVLRAFLPRSLAP
ncbi:TetR/AcrR family transcriptional regulator [Mycobacterium sp. 48b]|uniref:TetR/AcrR family transcriptional regulator n=1 Tax=Mycobacterium sp. 48b TaxID=3400426 RepID=UPI003AB063EC